MAQKIVHNFHGIVEPVRDVKLPELPTWGIELIEFFVAVSVLLFIFYTFKNWLVVNSFSKTKERPKAIKLPKQEKVPGHLLPEKAG